MFVKPRVLRLLPAFGNIKNSGRDLKRIAYERALVTHLPQHLLKSGDVDPLCFDWSGKPQTAKNRYAHGALKPACPSRTLRRVRRTVEIPGDSLSPVVEIPECGSYVPKASVLRSWRSYCVRGSYLTL